MAQTRVAKTRQESCWLLLASAKTLRDYGKLWSCSLMRTALALDCSSAKVTIVGFAPTCSYTIVAACRGGGEKSPTERFDTVSGAY